MEPENPIQPTEQERRIYDPVRVEHWEKVEILDDAICFVVSTGAIIGHTHEQITIIQSQIVNPPATGGQKQILWASVVSAYNLTTEEAIERPPE